MLCYQIYKSTSAKKKQKPILVNTGTNTLNMANVATNTMTTKELLAPLASMEDLSVCMTPMSTPGASPRTRARWSQRSSSRHVFTNFFRIRIYKVFPPTIYVIFISFSSFNSRLTPNFKNLFPQSKVL